LTYETLKTAIYRLQNEGRRIMEQEGQES
jgi:hypothetical protein